LDMPADENEENKKPIEDGKHGAECEKVEK
jgi:hypothetical protein